MEIFRKLMICCDSVMQYDHDLNRETFKCEHCLTKAYTDNSFNVISVNCISRKHEPFILINGWKKIKNEAFEKPKKEGLFCSPENLFNKFHEEMMNKFRGDMLKNDINLSEKILSSNTVRQKPFYEMNEFCKMIIKAKYESEIETLRIYLNNNGKKYSLINLSFMYELLLEQLEKIEYNNKQKGINYGY
jgi:hypothetical protein